MNVANAKMVDLIALSKEPSVIKSLKESEDYIKDLARIENLTIEEIKGDARPKDAAFNIAGDVEVFVPLKGLVDVKSETERINKELAKVTKEYAGIEKKLSNKNFTAKAPAEVITKEKGKLAEVGEKIDKLTAALERIKDL